MSEFVRNTRSFWAGETHLDVLALEAFRQGDGEQDVGEFRQPITLPGRAIVLIDPVKRREIGSLRREGVTEGRNVDDSDRSRIARLSSLLQERQKMVDEGEMSKVVPLFRAREFSSTATRGGNARCNCECIFVKYVSRIELRPR